MTTAAPAPGPVLPTRCSMLVRLAMEGATGALVRDAGTVYLADGRVIHAESTASPGVDVLLTAGGRLPRAVWDAAVKRAGPGRTVSRILLDGGHLRPGELEICLTAALFDAALFALAPGGSPARFRHGVAHRMGMPRPVPAAAVERETRRRRELLDRLWPGPVIDTAPVVPRPAAAGRWVPPRQRTLLDLADGSHTPADLSRLLGRPAFHVLLEVRRLAVAGLVDVPRETPRERPRAAHARPRTPDPGGAALPGPRASPPRPWEADGFGATDIALLRRVREALEAL
ncbi:transcriptional regulator [Streptomyces sp. NPDC052114]|uniref:transcriptional regulator n=1 Tax=unclassified Streptomyces TaxID=2593676 RepID=UPI0034322220